MPRGRPRASSVVVSLPRRVGRPPKTDRGATCSGRTFPSGFIPSGVIRSNFPRRQMGVRRFSVMQRIRGRGRPSLIQAQYIFDRPPEKARQNIGNGLGIDYEPSTSNQRFAPSNGVVSKEQITKTSRSRSPISIVPGVYDDINLVSLVDGAVGTSGTVKDLVCAANFQKLPMECQQYLLMLLPKRDCNRRPDGILEPSFSALKNEYLSAALLDFHERLYAGEVLWTGEIAPLPSKSPERPKSLAPSCHEHQAPSLWSPSSTSNCQASTAQMSPSSSSHPPLPKLRINLSAGRITIIPQEERTNGCSSADFATIQRRTNNSEEDASNCSGSSTFSGSSSTTEMEVDVTPYFATKPAAVSNSMNGQPRWSGNSEFQSLRGQPPANQKSLRKNRR